MRLELELELIQPHMAQKPVLRGEVGCACVAREVSVESPGPLNGKSLAMVESPGQVDDAAHVGGANWSPACRWRAVW